MRVMAILASHDEARFIDGCLRHLFAHGLQAYLIDNDSTDGTVEIAERHLGAGLAGIERMPREGVYRWGPILERKAQLATELDADWFVHMDPDEVRLPPPGSATLVDAIEEADRAGANAVNFQEFTFVPTEDEPDHDHARFAQTMRRYYAFGPAFPHRLTAWRRRPEPVDLASSSGHRVDFPGLRMHDRTFPMRHYLFLSHAHAVEKYVRKQYDPGEVGRGQHRVRAALTADRIRLARSDETLRYEGDDRLDATAPLAHHPVFAPASAPV